MMTSMQTTTPVVNTYAKLLRACGVFGLTHSADGNISLFRDHLARHLFSAVNVAVKVLGGDAPLRVPACQERGETDAADLMRAFADCGQLARYTDLAFAPTVESLINHSQHDEMHMIRSRWSSDPLDATVRLNKLLQDIHHVARQNRVITQSLAHQRQAERIWANTQTSIQGVLAAGEKIFACKVDLLHRDFVPKSKDEVASLHCQFTQGAALSHPDVVQTQSWRSAFHTLLSGSIPRQQKLLAWVYLTSYSHIHGPYTTAVFLFDGISISPGDVHGVLTKAWLTATDGHGHCFHWPSSTCKWADFMAASDDSKRADLLLGLESVALAGMYVRPRCLNGELPLTVGLGHEFHKEPEHA